MRPIILTTSLALIVFSCSNDPKLRQPKFPNDPKLLNGWRSFRQAVNKQDTTALLSLSWPCIYCTVCSSSPDSIEFMSVEEFYRDHFRDVFNDQLMRLMNDSSKVWAVYDNNSTFDERDSCLKMTAVNNNLADVFVSVRPGDEGLSVLIHFAKTDSSFKFYGLSTIP